MGKRQPASPPAASDGSEVQEKKKKRRRGPKNSDAAGTATDVEKDRHGQLSPKQTKVPVPNLRMDLDGDLQAALESALEGGDVEQLLGGDAGMPDREELKNGSKMDGTILKIDRDAVFINLGGPDEGVVPFEQFDEEEPAVGDTVKVIVRGYARSEGLYVLARPNSAVDVTDWSDLDEGTVVEATVTGSNNGGLDAKVGGVRAFIPISQIAEHRVEDLTEFVDQKLVCVVTECNPRRGNLVVSRRAILEREREERRKEQLEKMEAGDVVEGAVRSIKDFGVFIDLGGLDGMIHVSKLSWERIKHPSEVLEEGQKVKVR
ncbi:MAG: S1 RNA-binding domain-containing protein, partial [Planctomycetota bacterium]